MHQISLRRFEDDFPQGDLGLQRGRQRCRPAYALGRHFRDVVGEINQRVAAVAGNVPRWSRDFRLSSKVRSKEVIDERVPRCRHGQRSG